MIITLSNCISLLRAPLALLFLTEGFFYKVTAILLAMLTDVLDGYIARRTHSVSKLGTILDPVMDKFFVGVLITYFFLEGQLNFLELGAFFARDIALFLFGGFLIFNGLWTDFTFKAIWYGKVFTTLQFFILLALTLGIKIPFFVFGFLICLGLFAFGELYLRTKQRI
jgi:CDP-diacylglycerol---glycerol-3-phosphate 3-phosphatidyltransferase